MTSESLRHDVARATAITIVQLFAPLLREEEQHDAFVEVYERVKEGIDQFEVKKQRLEQRTNPEGK